MHQLAAESCESLTAVVVDYCCRDAYGMDSMFLHDPTAFAALLAPDCFTWKAGAVRVVTEGLACGATIMDLGNKKWNRPNAWRERPAVKVAVDVDAADIQNILHRLFTARTVL